MCEVFVGSPLNVCGVFGGICGYCEALTLWVTTDLMCVKCLMDDHLMCVECLVEFVDTVKH